MFFEILVYIYDPRLSENAMWKVLDLQFTTPDTTCTPSLSPPPQVQLSLVLWRVSD